LGVHHHHEYHKNKASPGHTNKRECQSAIISLIKKAPREELIDHKHYLVQTSLRSFCLDDFRGQQPQEQAKE
jgi:hypothetical protein